ncbi:cytochrome P450 94C1-like [Silene latifolia]|uniref:cytochrome P450 94C1-like n=1 Tax=Silene latifolia TaxID=37657 RepID=UPI003D784FCE
MELNLEPSLSWYQSIHGFSSHYLFFNFHINILLLFFLVPLIIIPIFMAYIQFKMKYFHCKCDTCHSYVTSSWSNKFTNLCDWYTHLLQNSPTKTIHIHVLDNIITSNPKNVEYILKTNFNNYPKGKPFSTILGDLLGHGIFNVDGESWRFQRKMANLELDRYSVRSYSFQVVNEEIERQLMPYLSSKSEGPIEVDLQEMFRAFSFCTISRFSFGVEIEALQTTDPLKEFAAAFDLATKLSAERALEVFSISWKLKRFFGVGSEKKLRNAIKKIDALAMEVINKRRNKLQMDSSTCHQKDLLSRFMGVMDNNDRYLRDIIVSFVLAGRDTVASTLTSFFLLVATHPEVESKILLEVDDYGQVPNEEKKRIITYDQIKGFNYLQAALFECMRIYPPVQFDSKFALNDDVLPDMMRVKKGKRVTYHPYAMGRMEEIWGKDCLEFKPERWLKNGIFFEENPYKYPVFQAGVRVCLGKEMALMEIKCVIISLLREFHFELVNPSSKVPHFSPGLTATFKGGLPMLLHGRKK